MHFVLRPCAEKTSREDYRLALTSVSPALERQKPRLDAEYIRGSIPALTLALQRFIPQSVRWQKKIKNDLCGVDCSAPALFQNQPTIIQWPDRDHNDSRKDVDPILQSGQTGGGSASQLCLQIDSACICRHRSVVALKIESINWGGEPINTRPANHFCVIKYHLDNTKITGNDRSGWERRELRNNCPWWPGILLSNSHEIFLVGGNRPQAGQSLSLFMSHFCRWRLLLWFIIS